MKLSKLLSFVIQIFSTLKVYLIVLLLLSALPQKNTKELECEVCVKSLENFATGLIKEHKFSPSAIEEKFIAFCQTADYTTRRFCYYLGGLDESPTKILSAVSKPISWGLPPEKICMRLRKMDEQICELRYKIKARILKQDLKKLSIKELKDILFDMNAVCEGCIEKQEFIDLIKKLKSKTWEAEL